jgi:hypothetical protein
VFSETEDPKRVITVKPRLYLLFLREVNKFFATEGVTGKDGKENSLVWQKKNQEKGKRKK